MKITEKEFLDLQSYIKNNYGINLIQKKDLIVTRLENILNEKQMKSFSEYYKYILEDTTGDAVETLLNKVTTNYTFFLRENDHFDYFKNTVLPDISAGTKDNDLRVWSAGCSSGEEAYTLAMIMYDYFGNKKLFYDTSILATDISNRVLDIAKSGIYSNEQLDCVPKLWKTNYFNKVDEEKSIVTEKIKSEVIFRIFNLMNEKFPFKKKFHAIFCRNVMIYFDTPTKEKLIQRFYECTEKGGYLFIGHSETINHEKSGYQYVSPAIYKKG